MTEEESTEYELEYGKKIKKQSRKDMIKYASYYGSSPTKRLPDRERFIPDKKRRRS